MSKKDSRNRTLTKSERLAHKVILRLQELGMVSKELWLAVRITPACTTTVPDRDRWQHVASTRSVTFEGPAYELSMTLMASGSLSENGFTLENRDVEADTTYWKIHGLRIDNYSQRDSFQTFQLDDPESIGYLLGFDH